MGCRAVTGAKTELKEREGGLNAASVQIEKLMQQAQAYKYVHSTEIPAQDNFVAAVALAHS